MPHVDLLELPYFEGISEDDLVSLVDTMEPQQFVPGHVIVKEGDPPPSLYIATAGKLEISKRGPENSPRSLAELDSPTLFGEIELFCQCPSVATVRAITAVQAFKLTRLTFEQLFDKQHPAIMRFTFNVARVACHRLAVADGMLAHVLKNEDLVKLRRLVFADLAGTSGWSPRTTGAFLRPKI